MNKKKSTIDRIDEIGEDTVLGLSIKTLIALAITIATVVGMWFALQADIEEAKNLPQPLQPEISRVEFDLKDQLVRQTIMTTQEDVKEIKVQLDKLNDKMDAMK
ncbi:MAG: hypothetical protein HOG64_01665 [Flavobacteriaceae bacterium]|jgi:hypothetical protein|nr:hypothetical protein [Flavobacteriaceae bacterium]|tara:strand:+ start:92 stop:403 length:312 start_codon:yes stop_codon:yes gene_type:complete